MINNFPPNWSLVKLNDIVKNFKRGPFGSAIKKSFFVSSGYKVYEQKNAIYNTIESGNYFIDNEKFNKLKDFEVVPGDFIVSCSGTIGKIYRLPSNAPKGVINQALLRIRLNESKVFINYFLEFFKSYIFQKQMLVETRGSAMLNIAGVKELKQIPFPLPPLPEQKKIVTKIDELFSELDNGIEQLKKAKEQIKIYKQSVLSYAFSGKLVQESQRSKVKSQNEMLKAAEPKIEYKNNGLPECWKWKSIKDITSILGDGLHGTPKYTSDGDYYFINGNNLSEGKIELKNSKRVSKEEYEKYKKPLNERTVFVSINGTLGKTAFYNNEKIILGKSACYFNLKENIDKRYVRYFITTQKFINYANKTATGSTIKNVSLKAMREFEIPLSPSIEGQNQIVEEIESRFSVADKLEQTIDENLTKSETLRQSILKQAFEGRLVKM